MYGRCLKCGRKLTDQISRARGFGPECWAVIKGLPEPRKCPSLEEQLPGQINLFDYMETGRTEEYEDEGKDMPPMPQGI